ncbi:MAG: cation:proton antiporter [Candidatus Bathyarchaeia archaeon]|jgi:Kef-type K+ transport system membrane component KefB
MIHVEPFSIITDILIVLAAAILLGELFERFRLPAVVGEILSGMIIGPSLLGLVVADDPLRAVSSIALFFIIFHIGFEMKTQMIQGRLRVASLLSITSFLIPLVLMVLIALLIFPFSTSETFVLALAVAVPSLSIVSVLIWQYNLLKTTAGQIMLASVTISDVLAFIFLAGILRPIESTLTISLEVGLFIAFYAISDFFLNRKPEVFQKFISRAGKIFRRQDFAFALLIVIALLISVVFQNIGLSYILGAFFAGLILHDGLIGRKACDRISQTFSTMNSIFFVPLFFGFAGVEVILSGIDYLFYVGLALLIAVALGVGVSLTYLTSKRVLSKVDLVPKQLAGILGGKGAIGIVIATVAFSEGFLSEAGFSLVIVATLIVSLIIPFVAGRKTVEEPKAVVPAANNCSVDT